MMIWKILVFVFSLVIGFGYLDHTAVGQEQGVSSTANDTIANEILNSLQRIIEQNDDSSRNAVISSYLGMMAFLTGLALVIFGLQMSRAEKVTPTARRYYQILILALILPVIAILIYAYVNPVGTSDEYLGPASLLIIPAGAVLVLSTYRKLLEKL